ncbi:MAG: biotin--[acetyl-CoA-carboxylase] ligase [Deltaproteobacteria bacterium]|jgi:BirA family biotin operon repressor/biotin-[acetyl-CoA-carboxylase] ligase|nr:biotin--[acetyl-CoA-carboxylase] ligase [Deltaproteobacteria bacterium]
MDTNTPDDKNPTIQTSAGAPYLDGSDALLFRMGELGSVMDASWELLKENRFPPFSSVTATSQTAGRGRFGRTWASPPGNIYASLRLPDGPPYVGTLASVALAYELSVALEALLGVRTLVKWPNDLLLDGAKVGGILLEGRMGAVIAGVGINTGAPPDALAIGERPEGAPPAGSIPGSGVDPAVLWLGIAKSLYISYSVTSGQAACRHEPDLAWAASYAKKAQGRLFALGGKVTLLNARAEGLDEPLGRLEGSLEGLSPSGSLLLQTPQGLRAVNSGTLLA